ncbi:MAG TPA: thiamine pyrophosphate-binding protein [Thermomicrobiales bacterium]|jgi:acetolactate synthase-1/2/3 large subunit
MTIHPHVGDLLAEILATAGVEHVFGVPGGQTRPLYDGIFDRRPRIDHVLVRDERSGIYAADGYARASGRLGVCDATVGPGATNLVSGLAEALNSSTPLLAIVADIPRDQEHHRLFGQISQGFRQADTLRPVAKALFRLDDPSTAASTIATAIQTALSGRPGPVVLEIPDDVFAGPVPLQDLPALSTCYPLDRAVAPSDALDRAAALLRAGERPILLVGSGAVWSGAWEEVAQLAEKLAAPVLTSITGKGIISDAHPLSAGVAGVFGRTGANHLLAAADTIFAIGCKLGQLTTFSWRYPRPDQRLIQLDVDSDAISSSAREALVGDARDTLRILLDLLQTEPSRSSWGTTAVAAARDAWQTYNATLATEPGTVDPRDVVDAIAMTIGPDDVLVCDASLVSGWGAAYLPIRQPGRRFMAPRGLAGIGWGGPAALGAQTALGSTGRAIALIGDGAWGYSLAEVETAVRRNLPITFVILNNSSLAWVLHDRRDTGKALSCDFLDTDYAAAATAFGATGIRVGPTDDLETALAAALRSDQSTLLDIKSSRLLSPVLSPPADEP